MTFHRYVRWVAFQISQFQGAESEQVMLEQGLISRLVDLTKSDDLGLRLNALWAFKNLLHKSSSAQKQTVMTALGWATLSRYGVSPPILWLILR